MVNTPFRLNVSKVLNSEQPVEKLRNAQMELSGPEQRVSHWPRRGELLDGDGGDESEIYSLP